MSVRIPFKELGSKKCIVNRIESSLPAGINLNNVLDVQLWDIIGGAEYISREHFGGLKVCADPQGDLEHISSFIPDNSRFLQGKEIIQLLNVYFLSLICEFDLKYQKRLHDCLANLCKSYGYYPRKIPMTCQSRSALCDILEYLDNPENIKFERKCKFFKDFMVDSRSGYSYLNSIRNSCCWKSDFDTKFLSWIYKNILKVNGNLK